RQLSLADAPRGALLALSWSRIAAQIVERVGRPGLPTLSLRLTAGTRVPPASMPAASRHRGSGRLTGSHSRLRFRLPSCGRGPASTAPVPSGPAQALPHQTAPATSAFRKRSGRSTYSFEPT